MAVRAEDLHRFSVDEYLRLAEGDRAFDRTELINGVILDVSPESHAHATAVRRIGELLGAIHGSDRTWTNGSVRFFDSLWNPDVYVLKRDVKIGDYPFAAQVQLAVEVSLNTNHRDLGAKLDTYATEGVGVYWVVMPRAPGWAICHSDLAGRTYREINRYDLPAGNDSLDALPWA